MMMPQPIMIFLKKLGGLVTVVSVTVPTGSLEIGMRLLSVVVVV